MLELFEKLFKKTNFLNVNNTSTKIKMCKRRTDEETDEYIKEVEAMTFAGKLRWVSKDGINTFFVHDTKNNKWLTLIIHDEHIYLAVSSDDIYRKEEFEKIFPVTKMKFPRYVYENVFNLTT